MTSIVKRYNFFKDAFNVTVLLRPALIIFRLPLGPGWKRIILVFAEFKLNFLPG
jgi:hypothetical protein